MKCMTHHTMSDATISCENHFISWQKINDRPQFMLLQFHTSLISLKGKQTIFRNIKLAGITGLSLGETAQVVQSLPEKVQLF